MKKFIIYIAIASLIVVLVSCKKDLTAPPSQALVEGTVVIDQKSAENALNGAYARFVNVGVTLNTNTHQWSSTQEIGPAMWAGMMQYAFGALQDQFNNITPAASASYWTPPYRILNAANAVITEVGTLEDSKFNPAARKNEILTEARFLRAFAHWMLLGYFSEWNKITSPHGVL